MWIRVVMVWMLVLSVAQATELPTLAFVDSPTPAASPFQLGKAVALRDAPGRRLHRVGAGLAVGGFSAVALSLPLGVASFGASDSTVLWATTGTLFFGGAAAAITGVSLMTVGSLRSSAYAHEVTERAPLRGLSVASPILVVGSVGLAVWAFTPGGEGYKIAGAGVLLATSIALPILEQSASGRTLRGAGFTDLRLSPSFNGVALSGRF